MTTSEDLTDLHPFDLHSRRDPLPKAGARIVAIGFDRDRAATIAEGIADFLRKRGREAEPRPVSIGSCDLGAALAEGIEGAELPLVIVSTATEPWPEATLDALLGAIDKCDHVWGCRRLGILGRIVRFIAGAPLGVVFAIPVGDVHAPCRVHRREALGAIPLQSSSSFLDVEILAKATFLGQLIDEATIEPIAAIPPLSGSRRDAIEVFQKPIFKRVESAEPVMIGGLFGSHADANSVPGEHDVHVSDLPASSIPLEEFKSDEERADRPRGEDCERAGDAHDPRPLEQDAAECVDELGERERLDERLHRRGEPLGREEDTREEPHRYHDEVHESADGLGRVRSTGDEQADSGEGERAEELDDDQREKITSHGHMKREDAHREEHADIGDEEGEPGAQHREQEVAAGHGRGAEAFEELGDAEVDEQKPDAPEPPAHRVERDQSRD